MELETPNAILFEIQAWENVIHSEEWIYFRKLLDRHADFLQKEVNAHLSKHEDRKAGESLRALQDCKMILTLVTKRISELRNKSEKGEK